MLPLALGPSYTRAMIQTLVVPEAERKNISPRRSIPGSAQPMTAATAKRALAKAKLTTGGVGGKSYVEVFRAGMAKGEPARAELMERALAFLADPTVDALVAADIETLAAAEVVLRRTAHGVPFVGIVGALRSIDDAVATLHRSTFHTLDAGSGGWTTAVWLADHDAAQFRDRPATSHWLPLRHAIAAAPPDLYGRAMGMAGDLRAQAPLRRRAPLAYVFPDEPWADEDLVAAESEALAAGSTWLVHSLRANYTYLLSAARDALAILRAIRHEPRLLAEHGLDLAHVLPSADMIALCTELLPLLLKKPPHGPLLKTPPRAVAAILTYIRTPEAAAALAPYAAHPVLAPLVLGFFRDAPELAPKDTAGKGAAAVARVVARKTQPGAVSIGEAPPVLRDRPWRPAKGKKVTAPEPIVDLPTLGLELERVELPLHIPQNGSQRGRTIRPMTPEEHAAWRKEADEALQKATYLCADFGLIRLGGAPPTFEYAQVPDEDCIWAWNTGKASLRGTALELVARHGLAVVPGFTQKDWLRWLGTYDDGDEYLRAAQCLISPRIAPRMARVAARRKQYRRVALQWLGAHAELAALGLVPDAVGPSGEAKDDAEEALRFLALSGHRPRVSAAAARYGEPASAVLEALLDRDPLAIDVAAPKPPPFLRLAELPPVALVSGGHLDDDARAALVEMLQVSPADPPYPGIALVRQACTAESLGAFALELLELWVLGDAPGRHDWMLAAIVHFPSVASERRISALAREWARKNQEKAKRACGTLAALGEDAPLMHLTHIAETTRFDALRTLATELVRGAADARGLTQDELGDRTVPDLGLDADGTVTLSYGARQFRVSLDETLRPRVFERLPSGALGPPSTTPPRPTKTDDAEAAKAARERFDALRADLEAIADRQRQRLERAMGDARSWTAADFEARLAHHPLLGHLAKRVVWVATSAGAANTFRVAEDGSLADVEDRTFSLAEDARVRLAHPAIDALDAWATLFADYTILQPFEQLARTVFRCTPAEAGTEQLERTAGIPVAARRALGILESRGFRREDAGYVGAFIRTLRTTDGTVVVARLPLEPGFEIRDLRGEDEQITGATSLATLEGTPAAWGALTPLAFSELVRAVEALRAS